MALSPLDLPIEAHTRPGWWSMAIYRRGPAGYRLAGYSKPAWQTYPEHVEQRMALGPEVVKISYRWWNGEWVRL